MADPLDSPPITSIDQALELTGSGIASREIDPVLSIHLLTMDNFLPRLCSMEHREIVACLTQLITSWSNQISSLCLSSIPHRFRSASHSVSYRYLWRGMSGHMDGSILNDDLARPGSGSRTQEVLASSSSSQPTAVGFEAGQPG